MNALIFVDKSPAAIMYLKIFNGVSKIFLSFIKRLIRYKAITPSIVLPKAIPIQVAKVPWVVIFTKNAPMKTAGHILYPQIMKAAIEIPVGSQKAEALWLKKAMLKLNLPTVK